MYRFLKAFLLTGGIFGLLLFFSLVWFVCSASGLQSLARLSEEISGGRLRIERIDGHTLGRFDIEHLRWHSPELSLDIQRISLDWSPLALRQGQLAVTRLDLADLSVSSPSGTPPTPLPADLQWPWLRSVQVGQFSIGRLRVNGHTLAREVHAQYRSDGHRHRLKQLGGRIGDVTVEGEVSLAQARPFALSGHFNVQGQIEDRPLELTLTAQGPLERFQVDAAATRGVTGRAQAVMTPLALFPYERLSVQLDGVNPAAWQGGMPQALLSIEANLMPEATGVSGRFSVLNQQPGAADRQRLPLIGLDGYFRWQEKQVVFSDLLARLPGGGRLVGQGAGRDRLLQFALTAHQINLEKLFSRMRSTRLSGPLSVTLGAERHALRMALRDERFRFEAEAVLRGEHLQLQRLQLAASDARLDLQGEMQLDAARRFSVSGHLQRFDPSHFAKLPAARINADWQARGQLTQQPQVEARFTIHDSQIVEQPLHGQGVVSLAWPHVRRADVELHAGRNHLNVSGAYGRPDDRLRLEIDARNLDDLSGLGLEGGVSGQGEMEGEIHAPILNLRLSAEQLGWRGHFRLERLGLALSAGKPPSMPLSVDVSIGSFDLPERPALLKNVHLHGEGSLAAQRLRAETDINLAGPHHLALALAAAWDAASQTWSGKVLEARLQGADRVRDVRLRQPAPFGLSAERWQLGPVALSSSAIEGEAILQARADAKAMQVNVQAHGPRIGQVSGELQATMQSPWLVERTQRWQGRLHTDIPDLGWLAEWGGEGWISGGRLQGELQVTGTPVHPLASGRLQGGNLSLRWPEQGLSLAHGTLDVELRENLMRIRRFVFDSLLQPPPPALRLSDDENLARLMAQPGHLDIAGEIRLDQKSSMSDAPQAANAWLEMRLDRVGAWQRADQWMLVSGTNRMGWKDGVLELRGQLSVDAGYWQLARVGLPRLSDDVQIRRVGAPPSASTFRPRLDLDITADLGRHFLFEGAGLTSGLAGQVRLIALGRDLPRASGTIRARDGRFEAYGQKLAIERGILRFNGLLDNPSIDVRAIRKGLAVEPGVQIVGTAQKPIVKLVSEPELPETEKLAWLVLGHGSEQLGAGDATLLLSAAGGLLGNDAGNMVDQLRKTFGFDEIGIRQGSLGDNGGRAPVSRVASGGADNATANSSGQQIFSIAKRLSSNILLSYEQAMGKAESLVKLTVNLGRQISVIGRAGSDNAIDILYTMSFGNPSAPRKSESRKTICSGRVDCPE